MIRRIFISIISLVLCHQPLAFEGQRKTQADLKAAYVHKFVKDWHTSLEKQIQHYNEKRNNSEEVLSYFKGEDKDAAKNELRKARVMGQSLPKLNYKDGQYYARIGQDVLSFSALDIYKKQVRLNGKLVGDLDGESFHEKLENLNKIMRENKSFSFIDLFVPKAHAIALFLGVIFLTAAILINLANQLLINAKKDNEKNLLNFDQEINKAIANTKQCQEDLENVGHGNNHYLQPPGWFASFTRILDIKDKQREQSEAEMRDSISEELGSIQTADCLEVFEQMLTKTTGADLKKLDYISIANLCQEQQKEMECLEEFYAIHRGHIKENRNSYDEKTGTYRSSQIHESQLTRSIAR